MKTYRVLRTYSRSQYQIIEAKSEKKAEEIAIKNSENWNDCDDGDFDEWADYTYTTDEAREMEAFEADLDELNKTK